MARQSKLTRARSPPPSERFRLSTFRYGGEDFVVLSTPAAAPALETLTPSEEHVLAHLMRGMSNAAIARARETSVRTVANQVASLFRKTGARSRTELAQIAARSARDEQRAAKP
jgi:DNA-binding NarL/FixJ family response regulator